MNYRTVILGSHTENHRNTKKSNMEMGYKFELNLKENLKCRLLENLTTNS